MVWQLQYFSCASGVAATAKEVLASLADRVSPRYQLKEVFSVVQSVPPFRMEVSAIVASGLVFFV
jgi:hypothetical protein